MYVFVQDHTEDLPGLCFVGLGPTFLSSVMGVIPHSWEDASDSQGIYSACIHLILPMQWEIENGHYDWQFSLPPQHCTLGAEVDPSKLHWKHRRGSRSLHYLSLSYFCSQSQSYNPASRLDGKLQTGKSNIICIPYFPKLHTYVYMCIHIIEDSNIQITFCSRFFGKIFCSSHFKSHRI